MKQTIITIILIISFCATAFSQTNPQFGFYAESDYSSLINSGDDYKDYWLSKIILVLDDDISNREKLQICYRMYEITHTSVIVYKTTDDEPLPLKTSSDSSFSEKIPVDFGADLEDNDDDDDGVFALWFSSPVSKIDPSIFSCRVTGVSLPDVENLEYQASPWSCVRNLVYIKGKDVVDNRLLVSRNGELIVAAVADLTEYVVPRQVSRVGAGSFRGCPLQEVTIPEHVQYIGDNAFDMCDGLKSVYILSSSPLEITPTAFNTSKKLKYKIYVPKQSCKAYQAKYPFLKKRIKGVSL
jgi:hypothetical protein